MVSFSGAFVATSGSAMIDMVQIVGGVLGVDVVLGSLEVVYTPGWSGSLAACIGGVIPRLVLKLSLNTGRVFKNASCNINQRKS